MWAACTAASWRASNSDWVTMSPFTLATSRSTISALEEADIAAKAAATAHQTTLRRMRTGDGFMIHLGPGHEAPDELADTVVRLAAHQLRARRLPAFGQAGRARGHPLLHA